MAKYSSGEKDVSDKKFVKRTEKWISSLHRAFRKITSTINQQVHLYNFHLKRFKTLKTTPTCFDLFRQFRRSLLNLLQIHDLVRFYKQVVVAAYHVV